ncbi:hypothetical protein L0Y46_03435 [bacterium]|nr:hypothetical protein [bacterium]
MTKNPFLNALSAVVYIGLVAAIMFYGPRIAAEAKGDSIIAPIAMISLFTLSAAVMGHLFLYRPFQLYFDNNKNEAVRLFLGTVASFAVITIVLLAILVSGVL